MTFTDFSKRALIALAVASVTLPAAAFDGATDFAPGGNGPDPFEPGFAPNPPGGGGGGGGGSAQTPQGEGYIANSFNECPNGELIVEYDLDSDGHPIPSSFERTCVVRR